MVFKRLRPQFELRKEQISVAVGGCVPIDGWRYRYCARLYSQLREQMFRKSFASLSPSPYSTLVSCLNSLLGIVVWRPSSARSSYRLSIMCTLESALSRLIRSGHQPVQRAFASLPLVWPRGLPTNVVANINAMSETCFTEQVRFNGQMAERSKAPA
jgi:hypothetical protein